MLIRQLRRAGITLRDIADFLHHPDQARLQAFERVSPDIDPPVHLPAVIGVNPGHDSQS